MQGCSHGLECFGLEEVLRRFLERLSLVSVLKVEHLGLEGSTSWSRLGLEDITSRVS